MAISFEESLNSTTSEDTSSTMQLSQASVSTEESGIMTLSEETSEEIIWTADKEKYRWYNNYRDDDFSTVDSLKNIKISPNQINLTQEENSQVIPFMLDRYYDGIDLTSMTFRINFVNQNGDGSFDYPVNFMYSDDKIKFYFKVPAEATAIKGKLRMEIYASGENELGEAYKWRTRPNDEINILESLEGNRLIEPSEGWDAYLEQIDAKVLQAQNAATEAQNSATEAQNALSEIDTKLENTAAEVTEIVKADIADTYYTRTEAEEAHQQLQDKIDNIDVTSQLDELETKISENYYDKDEIDTSNATLQENIDAVSDALTQHETDSDTRMANIEADVLSVQSSLSDNYYTSDEVDEKISNIDISGELETLKQDVASNYYNKEEIDTKVTTIESSISDIDSNVSTLESNVSALESKVATIESAANTNKENISTISTKITDLESTVNGIDQSPRLTYDATYDESYTYTLWEIEGEGSEDEVRTAKSQFVIQGGGGGSSTSSILKIEYVTKTPITATVNDKVLITYNFSGTDSSGDEVMEGTATWKVGSTVVATNIAVSGENTFDITDYISIGTQKVLLSIKDDAGSLVTKTWTVQKIDVRIESTFNDQLTYPLGTVSFDYTPYGSISKDVHFVLDGVEIGTVTTTASGIPMSYSLPEQTHGSHLLDVYITAEINNSTIETNHIYKDIIWYDESSDIPVIGCVQQEFTARQYDTINIVYTVYDPKTENPEVTLAVDDKTISTLTLDSNTQTWQYKSSDIGTHVLTITCESAVKTLNVTIEKLDLNLEPVTAGLVIDFNPIGKSNSDADRVWKNDTYKMTVSSNFDWVNGGYQFDDDGDQYFCIKAGTSVDIDYQMFADDAKRNGKEMKLVFKTTNVQEANALFMSCVDNTTGTDHIGIEMYAHEAYIYGSADKLYLPYSENDIIEFEFNINKDSEEITEFCGYEDGVSTRHMVYDDSFNFTQNTPKTITLGSDKCDLHIYRLKIYNTSLSARSILNNFIADARNADEMINRYNRNQIYDENQNLTAEILAEACPWLRVYKLSAPYFTNKKKDKVAHTTIQQIYKNGDQILDNWTCYNASHSGQGTSSDNYGAAGRNLDFIMNNSQLVDVKPYFILGDGETRVTEISQTRTSVPVAYLNFKANIASSNNFTNALLAKRFDTYNPYTRIFFREDGFDTSIIRDTMEFHNAVVFIQETDEDLSTHREFADTDWHKIA